ncbi:MAG: leucine-rich repeat protein [Clostridia bacterium]|nr:leucine-rich repeat protein [Clostridia bacterium]
MKKRFLAFILAATMAAAVFTGCDEDDPKATDSNDTGDTHVHALAEDGVFDRTTAAKHYFTCKDCGETVSENHSYEYAFDANEHIKTCVCGKTQGKPGEHILEDGKCIKCGWENDPNHTHDFTTTGVVDETYHSVKCNSCGRKENQPHNLVIGIENDMHYLWCECSYKSEPFPHHREENGFCADCAEMGITHVCNYNKSGYDNESHYFECECGKKAQISGHVFNNEEYTYDNSTHSLKCDLCDYTEKGAHFFDNGEFLYDHCTTCQFALPFSTGLEFELSGNSYIVIGIGSCKDRHIVVPDTYNGKPVTAIGSSAFEGNTNIVYVVLPDSVKSIGSAAFAGCTSLKAINIPDGVTVIRDNTFMGCTSLERVECENVSKIEMYAFYGCEALKGFTHDFDLNPALEFWFNDIGDYAFSDCRSLSFDLKFWGDTYIGIGAFSGCSSIVSVELLSLNDAILCGDAFSGCTSIKTVTVWNYTLDYLDIGTFSGCTSLEKFRVGYGQLEDYLPFFADSTVDEEMGLSWYEGCPDFTIEIIDSPFESGIEEVVASMKVSELYDYIDENYWQ